MVDNDRNSPYYCDTPINVLLPALLAVCVLQNIKLQIWHFVPNKNGNGLLMGLHLCNSQGSSYSNIGIKIILK